MSTNFFSSLSGKFDLNASMSSLYGDYSQIKSGAYGTLLKSYVKKVGNGNALKAYQETGSTTTAVDSATSSSSTKKSESTATKTTPTTTSPDKYSKLKSSWLDDQLKQYDKDANKTTAADTSVSLDTTV